MSIQFFLPMQPPTVTAQQKGLGTRKNGKPYAYEKFEVAAVRQCFRDKLRPHCPEQPLGGGIQLITKWVWGITSPAHRNGEYKRTKPDTDNVLKLFKDAMTDVGFWRDDAQVCSEVTEKFWGDVPGIWVYVEEIEKVRSKSEE